MATRFKVTDLKEMIRSIVRDEMTGVVKEAINEVLSERYLKKLAEASVARPRGVGPTLPTQDDPSEEEEIPQTMRNDTRGIYRQEDYDEEHVTPDNINPMLEGAKRNDVLSALFFQGTKPLKEVEASAPIVEGVSLENLSPAEPGKKPITEVWKTLAGVGKKTAPSASQEELEAREEARLKMLREQLERPING